MYIITRSIIIFNDNFNLDQKKSNCHNFMIPAPRMFPTPTVIRTAGTRCGVTTLKTNCIRRITGMTLHAGNALLAAATASIPPW